MQMVYRTCLSVGLAALLIGLARGQQPTPPPQPIAAPAQPGQEAVAATVNGQPIGEVAVQRALRSVPKEKQPEIRPEVMTFLIDNALIEQYLVSQKIGVELKEIEDRLGEVKQQMTKEKLEYTKVLADMMLTEPELRQTISAEIRWQKYIDTQANEKVLKELFEQHPDMFDGSMVRARHILLTPASNDPKAVEQSRQQLLVIRKQIEDTVAAGIAKLPANADAFAREKERAKLIDEAFAEQAKKNSACPSKGQGGDVDWFPRAGAMVEPFAKVAFELKPFQMSDVVQTQFGLHIILPIDRRAGKPGMKFDEAKDDVKDIYSSRLREKLVEQLRGSAKIVVK
jgi:peptidyl-prolyl cis-trans isomerase C